MFCWKNAQTRKLTKWLSYRKIRCFVRVAMLKKVRADAKTRMHFFIDLSSFFGEKATNNWWTKRRIFSVQRLHFWTWRPSRNIVFYDTKATSCVFCVLTFSLEKRPKNDSKIQRPIRVPEITKDCRAGTHLGSKIVPNSRERGQKSLKLMEWPEFTDDPPSESLRQRSSERKLWEMLPRSPQEKVLFLVLRTLFL